MQIGRRIAFDYGDVRIGVAISDVTGLLATPLTTLRADSPTLNEEILEIFNEYFPIYLVVGEPKHLSGNASQKMLSVATFVEMLRTLREVPIYLVDERFSTVAAARTLRDNGKSAKESKKIIDQMAAVGILERALDKERINGSIDE